MKRILLLLTSLLLCSVTSGIASDPQAAKKETSKPGNTTPVDPCSLLRAKEVEAVQGAAVREAKRNEVPVGSLATVQCFYEATDFAKSVSLALVQPLPKGRATPRDYWMERFRGKEEKSRTTPSANGKEASGASGHSKKEQPPRPISGIGEEAYWVGNRPTGALYILHQDCFLRVSVGGPGDESAKLERTKTLAQHALRRLQARRKGAPARKN